MEKVMILGGRHGFGAAVVEKWSLSFPQGELVISSRREFQSVHKVLRCDFAADSDIESLIRFIGEWRPSRLFCFVGGGPFGNFTEKDFKDHEWAWKVSFQSPVRVLHAYLRACPSGQAILTGSAIAEDQPDAKASSYAASKHALRGLVSSIKAEKPALDVRLFSPGYMDTEMLPANSAPRLENRALTLR